MAKKVQQDPINGNPVNSEISLHPVVAEISKLEFQGNVVPHAWCRSEKLRQPNGKPDCIAMLILADVCYRYRATLERDASGRVVEMRQKFSADMLQKSYQEWSEQFGFTKRQIQDAVSFLIERGLIRRELRSLQVRGVNLYNVTFFEPIPTAIRELTADTYHVNSVDLPRYNLTPLTQTGDTPPENRGGGGRKQGTSHPRTGDTPPENGGDMYMYYTWTSAKTSSNNSTEGECVSQTPHITHTPPSSPSVKRKNSQSVNGKKKESPPELTYDQSAALAILCAYFPTLAAPHHQTAMARFIIEAEVRPVQAMIFCCWLVYLGRLFQFMKPNLLQELWSEFKSAKVDPDGVVGLLEYPIDSLERVATIYHAWEDRDFIAEPVAA